MASVPAPEYLYTAVYRCPSEPFGDPVKRDVLAAYFIEEGSLLIFKNASHQAVLAIRADTVLVVERGASA